MEEEMEKMRTERDEARAHAASAVEHLNSTADELVTAYGPPDKKINKLQ